VISWSKDVGMNAECRAVFERHRIDGVVLSKLSERDLREPPISMDVFGDMK
jgi:hypothetical protein